jgi:peptide/nickel transport system ATP-binding protein
VADRVVVMNAGEIVESGTVRGVLKNPVHPYTRKLIAAAPGRGEFRDGAASVAPVEPLLSVRGLRKTYGHFVALEGADFDLKPGETLAIVGESGSGKSTLAKTLLRLEEPTAGAAHYKGRDLMTLSRRDLFAMRREIQMVFQDPTQSLNPRMTVSQLISEAWVIHPELLPRARWKDRVVELLGLVGLPAEHVTRYPHQLSGGQRQRIAIARALALEPKLIICDEAVSALDVSIQSQVIKLLARLRSEFNLSYLFIAHDLPVVRDFADRVIVMQGGRIVETGTTERVFTAPREAYTRALLEASPESDPDIQAERRRIRELA